MAARRTQGRRRASARGKSPRKASARVRRSLARIESELPATLAQFSRRVQAELTRLEKQISRAGTRYRASWTRLLREASHRIGRFEAEGEARWKHLTARARADALKLLRRLEREIEPRRPKRAARRKPAARPVADTPEVAGTGI